MNVVIGVLVVHYELHVVVRVHIIPLVDVCDAVIDLTLVLIAHVVIVVFVVAIFSLNFAVLEVFLFTTLYTPVGGSELRWLLPNF